MITEKLLKKMDVDIDEAFKKIGEKYGVDIFQAGGTFNEAEATLKFKVREKGKNLENAMKEQYERLCECYGLSKDSYGKKVKANGTTLQLIGIQPKSRKFCIICKDLKDNKDVAITETYAHELFGSIYKDFNIEVLD